jgi:hypothetical protein
MSRAAKKTGHGVTSRVSPASNGIKDMKRLMIIALACISLGAGAQSVKEQ